MTDPTATPATEPAAGWTAPTPAPDESRTPGRPRAWEIGIGALLLGFGIWFFLDLTLGLDLPRLAWRDLWPVILIVLGGVIVLGALARRSD